VSQGTRQGGRPHSDERLQAACIAAAEFLAPRTKELADELLELLRAQLPAYGEETIEELRARIRVVLELTQRRLRQGEVPDSRDAEEIATLARGWAAKGLPLDPRSFQLGARRVVAVVAAHAVELNLDPRTMFEMQDRTWEWATMCASILADAHRDHAVALARRDAAGRAELLRDLVAGRVTAERLARAAQAYGLDVHQPYFAVCAHCDTAAVAGALAALGPLLSSIALPEAPRASNGLRCRWVRRCARVCASVTSGPASRCREHAQKSRTLVRRLLVVAAIRSATANRGAAKRRAVDYGL
jgi:hypothetical protein